MSVLFSYPKVRLRVRCGDKAVSMFIFINKNQLKLAIPKFAFLLINVECLLFSAVSPTMIILLFYRRRRLRRRQTVRCVFFFVVFVFRSNFINQPEVGLM